MGERAILKIALGFIILFILASGAFLATALFSGDEDAAAGMATKSNVLDVGVNDCQFLDASPVACIM